MQPDALLRGKAFHRRVQSDWSGQVEGSTVRPEHVIRLLRTAGTMQRQRHGRLDIFIDKMSDFVTVVEIKGTDWDRIRPKNRKKVLGSHRRQVLRYVDKFVDEDQVNVCAGVIYPSSPITSGLKEEVETYLNDHGLQVVWYDDK
jgi:hypothetical protein